jgi:hypothetical protein
MMELSSKSHIASIFEINKKGSIYGEEPKTPYLHSFRQSPRSGRSIYSNRAEILFSKTTILSQSTITHCGKV